jgi:hypothetical protein
MKEFEEWFRKEIKCILMTGTDRAYYTHGTYWDHGIGQKADIR